MVSSIFDMEALVFDPSSKILALKQVPIPKIERDDDVIVEVAYVGLCGTDLHIIKGEFPCNDKPFIQGHEFSGVVKEVGKEVINVKKGDKVAVDPQNWCTTCEFCTTAKYHLCTSGGVDNATGIRFNGGWAKYCKVRARQVYKLPAELSLKQGALCEPISCIVWGLDRGFLPTPIGSRILVTGAGIIGNLWSAILHHMGHRDVKIVEPSDIRIKLNQKMQTGYECIKPQDVESKLLKSKWAADVAIDCSGNGKAIEQAISVLNYSGKLCIFGVASPQTRISVSPYEMFKKELSIAGTIINPFSFKRALGLMSAMGDRYLNFDKLGVAEFQLSNYKEAMDALDKTTVSKVVFAINPNL